MKEKQFIIFQASTRAILFRFQWIIHRSTLSLCDHRSWHSNQVMSISLAHRFAEGYIYDCKNNATSCWRGWVFSLRFFLQYKRTNWIDGWNSNHLFWINATRRRWHISCRANGLNTVFGVILSAIRFWALFSLIGAIVISCRNVRVWGNNVKSEIAHDSVAGCWCCVASNENGVRLRASRCA